jgi:flagellar hook assembly protein FlgD
MGYDRRFDAIGQKPVSALLAADGQTLTMIGQYYQIASDLNERKMAGSPLASSPPPQKLALSPSYPNPFAVSKNAPARIPYALPAESEVRLQVFDVLGRLTREIVHARQTAGTYEAFWDGRNAFGGTVTSGIYFLVLNAGEQIKTQKIVVTR